jgi:solute:Na+ symporter, SSS family
MTTGELHWVALAVFVGLFLFVTVLGFVAARWKAGDLRLLDEWEGWVDGDSVSWSLGFCSPAISILRTP